MRDAHLVTVRTQEAETVGNDTGVAVPSEPDAEIHSAMVGHATVEKIAAVDLSIGDEIVTNETTKEGEGE